MTNQEIATRLVSLLREGKFNDVYDELFILMQSILNRKVNILPTLRVLML
nr:hypothetical protein [uncultured Allomuricauda sp.]